MTETSYLNSINSKLNIVRFSDNDKTSILNDKNPSLQSGKTKLQFDVNPNMRPSEINFTDTRSRWTRSNTEIFTAAQMSNGKRQMLYEIWKIQIKQVFIVN